MKGKKFDAHEKHFKEKEIKLNKEIKDLRESRMNIANSQMCVIKENRKLTKENLELLEKYEEAIKLSKLTDEEIQESINVYKSMHSVSQLFKCFPTFPTY